MNFDIKTEQLSDDAYVISLAGEVDLYTAPEFEQLLLELRRRVEIDLARKRDHVCVVAQLLGLDVEVHASPRLAVARSLTRRAGGKLLDQRFDLGRARRVRVELQVALVSLERRLHVAGGLPGLRELEPGARVVRLQLGSLVVGGHRVVVGELRPLLEIADDRVLLLRGGLLDRALPDRLAELASGQERRARRGELPCGVGVLVLLRQVARLRQLKPAHLGPRLRVLLLERGVRLVFFGCFGGDGNRVSQAQSYVETHPIVGKGYRELATAYEAKGDTGE